MDFFYKAVDACEKSIEYYSRYISYNTIMDKEDARQELTMALWRASKKYDPKRSSLKTYFITVLRTQMFRIMRWSSTQENQNIKKTLHLFHYVAPCEEEKLLLIDIIPDKRSDFVRLLEREDLFNRIERSLVGDDAKKIMRIIRQGETRIKEIADIMGMSSQHVCNIIRRKIKINVVKELEK